MRGDGLLTIAQNGFEVNGASNINGPVTVRIQDPLFGKKALHHAICVPLLLVLQVVGTGTFISNDPANNILTVESTASPYTGNVISMWKTGAGVSGNMMLFTQGSTPLVNVRRLVLSFKHRVLIPILPPSLA